MDHTSDIEVPSHDPKGIICDDDHLEMIEISDWSQNGNHSSIPDEETERPSNEKLLVRICVIIFVAAFTVDRLNNKSHHSLIHSRNDSRRHSFHSCPLHYAKLSLP